MVKFDAVEMTYTSDAKIKVL